MSSKRGKRTRNSTKKANKHSEQLCMHVIDHGATISSSNAQNHFGYAPFELNITVEPQPTDLEPQPITVQLVFEDGQQIDVSNNQNSISFTTTPSSLYLNNNGVCKFTVQIDTYSMFHDNRAFKLVFNLSDNATRHIRPCETKPFRLVKHRLEIVSEPDDTFYKDEGGRANCLRCKILLKDSNSGTVKNRDIPLTAKLVYEDMSVAQSSRDILEILTQNVELKKGQCCVDFRINEVSKNHNKRAFRVLYECKSQDALYHDISSCVTNKIMVKSKRTKKKGSRGANSRRPKREPKKRKREIKKKQQSPFTTSSEASVDLEDIDLESDDNKFTINTEPSRKRQRRGSHHHNQHPPPFSSHQFDPHLHSTLPQSVLNNMTNGDLMDNTQYVPPAITGILPSIRPGALPRIGHQPPPFSNLSKKSNPFKTEKNGGSGGGVLGHMFTWCKLAGWVMNKLEWTACGYEYDEATHSIDTTRPLYRCSYCLKYRNISGWGTHENWCQLKLALKEYETKVKGLYSEWNYQINNKDNQGQMTSLIDNEAQPPSNNTNNVNNNAKDKDKENPNTNSMTLPSIANNGPTISAGFTVNNNNNAPFIVTPNQSNGSLWGFAYHQQQQHLPNIGTNGINPFPAAPPPPPPQHQQQSVKNELNGNNHNQNNQNNFNLPAALSKVDSVSRVRSQHGYDAYDKDNNFVGTFDDNGSFFEADQFNTEYQPIFDQSNMLTRNQSDDYLFYNNIRNSLFDANHHK